MTDISVAVDGIRQGIEFFVSQPDWVKGAEGVVALLGSVSAVQMLNQWGLRADRARMAKILGKPRKVNTGPVLGKNSNPR